MHEDDLRMVNTWNLYYEAQRLLRPIVDKSKNIGKLNRVDFPMRQQEIDSFLYQIQMSLAALDSYLFNLHYNYDKRGTDEIGDTAKVRLYRAISRGIRRMKESERNELKSYLMTLKLILMEGDTDERKAVKRSLKNFKEKFLESKQYDELKFFANSYRMKALIAEADATAKSFRKKERREASARRAEGS